MLHAAVFGVFVKRGYTVASLQSPRRVSHPADLEISVEQAQDWAAPQPIAGTAEPRNEPVPTEVHQTRGGPNQASAATASTNPEGAPESMQAPNAPFTFSALTAGAQKEAIGLGGTSAEGPARSDKPAEDVGALRRALLAHDVEHGQGNLGAVSSAVDAVLRESNAPEGTATFVFDIPVTGDVKAWLHHASSGDSEFQKLEQALAKRIRNSKFKSSGQGTRVTVTVKVWQQFLDGTKPQDLGTKAEYSLGEATVRKDGTVMLSKPPGVILSTRGKVGGVGVYAGPMGVGITGGVSLENIGSPSRRMVSSNVTSAVPM